MIGAVIDNLISGIVPVCPLRAAQGKTLPLATYQIISNEPTNHIHSKAKNRRVSVQINVVGPIYDVIVGLAFSIIAALDRYNGTNSGTAVKDIRHKGGPDDMYSDDSELYGVTLDFDFWVKQ